ncbi:aquaporin family protein [Lactobacillus sp. ESL0785]|uniref:MIP/aquaporin family protein n=1 Tax=Lactobacillus sp. ESL0785 TaxID=2983232 RepID=UPI0023F966D3|nr:MIP/aquaporin family protein [Lactobacillus sp. ESL0785]WEV70237.1 aquaporin family protein [Lactobacillus sp. ESL0785]
MHDSLIMQMLGEFIGTAILVLLGDGICAAANLKKSKGNGAGWLAITLGWGFALALGIYSVSWLSPGHLNPAVTLGMAIAGNVSWSAVLPYFVAQVAGGFVGGIIVWLTYYPYFAATEDQDVILGTFATEPAIKKYLWNFFAEMIGTFMLVFGLLAFSKSQFAPGLNPLVAGLLLGAIGLSLGGSTGAALNPARDLGPRLVHQLFPIANKGKSDWAYAWVPVVAPFVGGILAALLFLVIK